MKKVYIKKTMPAQLLFAGKKKHTHTNALSMCSCFLIPLSRKYLINETSPEQEFISALGNHYK